MKNMHFAKRWFLFQTVRGDSPFDVLAPKLISMLESPQNSVPFQPLTVSLQEFTS